MGCFCGAWREREMARGCKVAAALFYSETWERKCHTARRAESWKTGAASSQQLAFLLLCYFVCMRSIFCSTEKSIHPKSEWKDAGNNILRAFFLRSCCMGSSRLASRPLHAQWHTHFSPQDYFERMLLKSAASRVGANTVRLYISLL